MDKHLPNGILLNIKKVQLLIDTTLVNLKGIMLGEEASIKVTSCVVLFV